MSKEKEKLKKIYNDNAKEGKLMYTKSTELFTIKDKENMYRTDFSEESNSKVDLLNPSRQENIKFLNGIISMEVTEELLESLKIEPEVEITHEGYLVKVVEDKLKKLWFVLYDKYLYCKKYFNYIDYKHKTDTTHKGMHSLTDAYIKEHGKVNILKNTLYRFEIYFNQKVKEYYCINEEDYIMWIKMLKKVTGSFNLFEKYEIVDKLTSGKFGIIRLLSNKETKENVVLKMINKKKLNSVELLEVKTEVEIMKICQHKNIVRLLDINEDDENKYLGKIFKFK